MLRNAGYTIVEMMIVLLIISIAASLVVPKLGEDAGTKLAEAARLLTADLGAAQIDSITHGDAPRIVVFDTDNHTYRIATVADPDTPVNNPIGNVPYTVTFGSGRARGLDGVTFSALTVGGDDQLGFGIYGQLDQAEDAVITLACDGSTITVTVQSSTGDVTISE